MNKEWLLDYDAHEREEYQKFLKEYKGGRIEYPPRSRFNKIKEPIADTTTNIWSLIPFYGSSLVHVHPISQDSLLEEFGWGTDRDINNLIQLAKDNGRVQFILDKSAIHYEPFDYLRPIMEEIHPPVIRLVPHLMFDKKEYKRAQDEYGTLCNFKFLPYVERLYDNLDSLNQNYASFKEFSFKFGLDYATIRCSGYHDLADKILDLMVDNPALAVDYLFFSGVILTPPNHNSFNLSYNPIFVIEGNLLREKIESTLKSSNERLFELGNNLQEKHGDVFPFELGTTIIKKLALGSEGFLGCINLMDRYKQHDLLTLLNKIKDGTKSKNIDVIQSSAKEASEILDALWKDADKIANLSNEINFGFSFSLGIIGTVVTLLTGVVGLLTTLGIKAADKKLIPKISDTLARKIHTDHLMGIYDFKKKYHLPSD